MKCLHTEWFGLPRQLNNTALYGKGSQLEVPLASIFEEYKAGKVRTVMMLRYWQEVEYRGRSRQSNEQFDVQ